MRESDLCEWIKKSHTQREMKSIEKVLKAFSEYVYAVDQEYLYSKNYLKEFIDSFIDSTKMIRKKRECMQQLLDDLADYKTVIDIDIDGVWTYEGEKNLIVLSNRFGKWQVNGNEFKCQIKFLGESRFVIAKEIDVSNEKIKEMTNLFKDRLNKKNDDK